MNSSGDQVQLKLIKDQEHLKTKQTTTTSTTIIIKSNQNKYENNDDSDDGNGANDDDDDNDDNDNTDIPNNGANDKGICEEPDIRSDLHNAMLLVLLYLLQGIPFGLLGTVSMLLQKRGASYQTQAKFSVVTWPFNLKLLWAPIVDSCFSKRFGRRKSWLVPVQLLIGLFMIGMSFPIDEWLGDKNKEANIGLLTLVFLILIFLVATQDIATDGWSLTMLQRRNIGYATICNSIGQSIGAFCSYTLLISLESPDFCNSYLRSVPQEKGIFSLSDFLYFWGAGYIVITSLIGILKKEEDLIVPDQQSNNSQHNHSNIIDTYSMAIKVLRIPAIQKLAAILLTYKFIWADYDSVSYLKFLDSGISNEKMISWSAIVGIPIGLTTSLLIARHVAGSSLSQTFIYPMPFRTLLAISGAAFIWLTPKLIPSDGVAPTYIYVIFMLNDLLYGLFAVTMQFGMAAFFLKISDPTMGGTYVTLLNTIINWGSTWPYSLALWIVEYLTWRDCTGMPASRNGTLPNDDHGHGSSFGAAKNDKCPIYIDGYYIETVICVTFGILWFRWGSKIIRNLLAVPLESWRVSKI